MKFIDEFKAFAVKGNVMDLAVGVIIGAAFTKIVNSIVDDIIMPPLGLLMGKVDFSEYYFVLSRPDGVTEQFKTLADAKKSGVTAIAYGQFINAVIQFLIVAFTVFLLVKQINRLRRSQAAEEQAAAPARQEMLLAEIRDALVAKK